MIHNSIWNDVPFKPRFPQLTEDISVDVAIIGGGITGITAAYLLAKAGKKVAVLEAHHVGGGTTGFSTGNLYAIVDEQINKIKSKHNLETAKAVLHSRTEAMILIKNLVKLYQLDCDLNTVSWYLFSEDSKNVKSVENEFGALSDAGFQASLLDSIPLGIPIKKAVKIDDQGQINPRQYILELSENIASDNCRIFENTKVIEYEEKEVCTLKTNKATIKAQQIIIATHTPKGILAVQTKLFPYREYAIAARIDTELPKGIFWEVVSNHHYSIRSYSYQKRNYILVLGEPHKVGQLENNEECFVKLEAFLRTRFKVSNIEFKWGAQHYKSADGLPFIGSDKKDSRIFYATGFSTDGLVYGTLSAMILTDLLTGRENSYHKYFYASRTNILASAKDFITENINVLGQYLKDIPGNVDAKHFDEVLSGQGKIIEIDKEKYAVHRDDKNLLHVVSAVCTHMECIVKWNKAERSWDCPCHGSRFTIEGEVIEGPAIADLKKRKFD